MLIEPTSLSARHSASSAVGNVLSCRLLRVSLWLLHMTENMTGMEQAMPFCCFLPDASASWLQ